MYHISFFDIGNIVSALRSQVRHKLELQQVVGEETKQCLAKEILDLQRIKSLFSSIGEELLDLDLEESVTITASWHKQA